MIALDVKQSPHARTELGNRGTNDHMTCEQTQYQWRQSKQTNRQSNNAAQNKYGKQPNMGTQNKQAVPTQNRFNVFNQGN